MGFLCGKLGGVGCVTSIAGRFMPVSPTCSTFAGGCMSLISGFVGAAMHAILHGCDVPFDIANDFAEGAIILELKHGAPVLKAWVNLTGMLAERV